MRSILISGANQVQCKDAGRVGPAHTVHRLAATPNVLIFMGSRKLSAAEDALAEFKSDVHASSTVVPLQLDITDDASIKNAHTFVQEYLRAKNLPGLDVLVNNAAIMSADFTTVYRVNVFGTVALSARSDPVLSHMPAVLPRRKPLTPAVPPVSGPTQLQAPVPDPPEHPAAPPQPHPRTAQDRPAQLLRVHRHIPVHNPGPTLACRTQGWDHLSVPTAPDTSLKRRPAVAAAAKRAKHLSDGIPPFLNLLLQQQAAEKRRSRSSERAGDTPSVPNLHGALPEGYFASSMFSPEKLPPPLFA
ncbi:hypothetical protein C8J57DRAFT_1245322 [Mycena rebaudengoi]|nr:hypothetical protein C8J57DRAFT_1245322 [Mycena rebaudengoi]